MSSHIIPFHIHTLFSIKYDFHLQTKEELRKEFESGSFEIAGQAGSVHGGVGIQANPSVIQSGVPMYDTISDEGKSAQEVYDTISARPESFHIITEAPPAVKTETKEAVEESFAPILLLAKEASATGAEAEEGEVGSSDGLESYFGQLLQVTHHTDLDENRNKNNQEDFHTNVTDNAAAELKDEIPDQSTFVGSTYNGPVKVSGENESQTIRENSHQKQVETHATAKEVIVGDSVNLKAKLEGLGSVPGHVQGSPTESTVIRYTWQNIPNRRIDSLPSTTEDFTTTIPSKIVKDSLDSSNSQVPDKIIDISYRSDFSQVPNEKPDTSHGSRSWSSPGNISHDGETLKPGKGESEKPALPAHHPILASLQNIQVLMIFSIKPINHNCPVDVLIV